MWLYPTATLDLFPLRVCIYRSVVALSSTLRSMGMTAKNQRTTNFKNTIEGFKTLIGRHYSDPVVQDEIKRQHYAVEQLPGDQIGIKVGHYRYT